MTVSIRANRAQPPLGARFVDTGLLHCGTRFVHLRAFDVRTNRRVVVKMPARLHSPWVAAALVREAAILERVGDDPHVVTLIDQLAVPDCAAAQVFERCAGSLAEMSGITGLSVRTVVSVGVKLCAALDMLHHAGFAHADVRPANVYVTAAGEPVLGGLDEAATLDAPEVEYPLHETRPQTPPELIEGALPTEATDVYGVGVTLYELVAGHPAFPPYRGGRVGAELGLRILRGARVGLPPSVPLMLVDLLDWAMAVDPAERPPAPAWLGEELRHFAHAQGFASRAVPTMR